MPRRRETVHLAVPIPGSRVRSAGPHACSTREPQLHQERIMAESQQKPPQADASARGARASPKVCPIRSARRGTASASTSRCSRRTRRKVELCLFDRAGQARARAHHAARVHRRGLARLPARRAAGDGLRLPRARAVRAGAGPSLQSEQAAARSLREGARRRAQVGRRAFRLHDRRRRRGPHVRRARQRAVHAEVPRRRSRVHVGPRAPAAGAVGAHDRLRNARARLHDAPSRRCPEELRGKFAGLARARGRQLHPQPRRHVDRAPAGAGVDRRSRNLVDKGLTNYWGYDTIGFFAPNPRYLGDRNDRASSRRWSRTCTTPASK